ncbi:alpha/beta fold hydrolase [Aquimarina hainanensis]|uniref:Alpha/beta fold hydrolase n=1 Tax=Aquimarina hainanensis TaxID=1578017 RepID=A0ABW5N9M1_9FLAO
MKTSYNIFPTLFFFFSFSLYISAQVEMKMDFTTPYGNNPIAGKYVTVNGAKIYYEEYGTGKPMFLIHGNGGSIKDMGNQIDYFKSKYRVIIADNRGHGKSELKTDSLTYTQIAHDWSELATKLRIDSLHIIGWSDGGIVSLLMGIYHPSKTKKIAAMGANLRPDTTAVYPWAVNWVKDTRKLVAQKIKDKDSSQNWEQQRQQLGLLGDQPMISIASLQTISAPVLIIAGDKDIIREEHTVEMYQNIPNAHLCILPGETHFTPATDPDTFNKTVETFFNKPFSRPDSDWTKQKK